MAQAFPHLIVGPRVDDCNFSEARLDGLLQKAFQGLTVAVDVGGCFFVGATFCGGYAFQI